MQYSFFFYPQGGKDLRKFTEATAKTLCTKLYEFHEIGALNHDLQQRFINKFECSNLQTFLLEKLYHWTCFTNYNKQKLEREKTRKRKLEQEASSNQTVKTRKQTTSNESSSLLGGSLLCMYCNKEEQLDEKHKECHQPLCAAGGRKKSPKYVEEFTEKLKMMAAELEETHILTLLNTTDVRAAELFYHRSCHASFIKRLCLKSSYCILFHNLKMMI